MALSTWQFEQILRSYDQTRQRNHALHLKRQEDIYEKIPEIKEIDQKIASQSIQTGRKILFQEDKQALRDLRAAQIGQQVGAPYPAAAVAQAEPHHRLHGFHSFFSGPLPVEPEKAHQKDGSEHPQGDECVFHDLTPLRSRMSCCTSVIWPSSL